MYTSEEYLAFSSYYREVGKLPIEDIIPSIERTKVIGIHQSFAALKEHPLSEERRRAKIRQRLSGRCKEGQEVKLM